MGAMTGFMEVSVHSDGKVFRAWQNIVEGVVLGYVDAAGEPLNLPQVYEMAVISGDLVEEIGA